MTREEQEKIVEDYFKSLDAKERRLKYLQLEVQSKDFVNDHVVQYLFRVLSNYASIDVGNKDSKAIKKVNKRMSKGALELKNSGISFDEWHKLTLNEHQKPIKSILTDWLKQKGALSISQMWSELCEYPMITITLEEDARLRKNKMNSSWSKDRYSAVGIEIIEVE